MNSTFFKHVKIALLIVCVAFVIVGVYFLFFYQKKDDSNNQKYLSVQFNTSDVLLLKNTLPVSDSIGKSFDGKGTEEGIQGYLEFSVKNKKDTDISYEIIVTEQNTKEDKIKDSFVKMYLTDNQDNPLEGFERSYVPTFYDFYYLVDKPSSKLLFEDSLKKGESKKYRLRVWLSDKYSLSFEPEEFSFDVDVRAK